MRPSHYAEYHKMNVVEADAEAGSSCLLGTIPVGSWIFRPFFFFFTGMFHCIVQTGMILLPQPMMCWDDRYISFTQVL